MEIGAKTGEKCLMHKIKELLEEEIIGEIHFSVRDEVPANVAYAQPSPVPIGYYYVM